MTNVCMKFLSRIADCTIDVNSSVHVPAMRLLLSLLKEGFLDEFEDEAVWERINNCAINPSASPEMRKFALEFVIEQLEAFDDPEDEDAAAGDEERIIVGKIDALASWVAAAVTGPKTTPANARVKFADYVVASLRSIPEHSSIATNWSALLRAINEDSVATTTGGSTADKTVDAVKQLVLLRMLMASVVEEVGSVSDADFLNGARGSKKNAKKARNTSHEKLSIELLKALPSLFVKFSGDSRMLQQIASLPRYLIHSVFSLPQRKADFTAVLKQIGELYTKSTDESVLTQCAMSLTHMAGGSHSRVVDAKSQVQKIVDLLVAKVNELAALKLSTGKKKKKGEIDADAEFALGLALTQLRILSKRVDVSPLMASEVEVETFFTAMKECAEKRVAQAKDANMTLAESKVVVKEAMEVNLAILGWKVAALHDSEDDKMAEEANEDLTTGDVAGVDDENDADAGDSASIVSIRDHLVELCTDALELKGEGAAWEEDRDSDFAVFRAFIQRAACLCVADLRSICAKGLKNAANATLRAVAFTDDSKLLSVLTKYVRGLDKGKGFASGPLVAIARDLVANWDVVNRREAGVVLSNIAGAGGDASKMVSAFIKVAKNKDGVKLLEAHMASLRSTYEEWQNSQPEELSDKPSDEEMERYAEESEQHEDMYNGIRSQASKLSSSLGVTKLSNAKMQPAMVGFVKEGLRYAFSCGKDKDGNEDQEQFGDRLSFLGPLKSYLSWIKKNAGHKSEIVQEYEHREKDFKSSLFYDEEVHEEVLKAFGDDFISALITRKRTRDETAAVDHADDSVFNPAPLAGNNDDDAGVAPPKDPSSKASSSMMSIAEEAGSGGSDEYEKGMFDGAGGKADDGSPPKRRRTRGQ